MNLQKLKLWTDALRSDEFEQGEGYLCKDGKYCCMGVAAEVAIKDGLNITKVIQINGVNELYRSYDEECAFMPKAVAKWLDCENIQEMDFSRHVDDNQRHRVYDGDIFDLIYLNDKVKLTFKQIADVLDKEFLQEKVNE